MQTFAMIVFFSQFSVFVILYIVCVYTDYSLNILKNNECTSQNENTGNIF